MSRSHARVEWRGRELWFIDLGSTSGSRVNGEQALRRRLRHGDVVEIGCSAILVEIDATGLANTGFDLDAGGDNEQPPPPPTSDREAAARARADAEAAAAAAASAAAAAAVELARAVGASAGEEAAASAAASSAAAVAAVAGASNVSPAGGFGAAAMEAQPGVATWQIAFTRDRLVVSATAAAGAHASGTGASNNNNDNRGNHGSGNGGALQSQRLLEAGEGVIAALEAEGDEVVREVLDYVLLRDAPDAGGAGADATNHSAADAAAGTNGGGARPFFGFGI